MHVFPSVTHIFIGKTKEQPFNNKPVLTAIFKGEIHEAKLATLLGFTEDEQADTVHHGGEDKALCVYLQSSYSYWGKYKNYQINEGSFGENLVFSHLRETDVCIGDIYKIGEAVVQISQPRQPCFKLGIRNEWKEMVVISRNSGYTGFYLRVLQEGKISPHDKVELIRREEQLYSIKYINELLYSNQVTAAQIKEVMELNCLAASCKRDLAKRLEKMK